MKQAFTLIEAIITVVILGILVTFAMPAYRVTQERALDKEAKANLKLIRAGERIYRIETDNSIYISCTGPSAVDCINSNLKLSIPPIGTIRLIMLLPLPLPARHSVSQIAGSGVLIRLPMSLTKVVAGISGIRDIL